MPSLAEKIASIETELRQLEKRRTFLLQSLYDLKAAQSANETKSQFTPLEKLKIFESLFVGRRDVYARGFKSAKYQKMGYSPACANADNQSLCKKGKIRCSQCPNRKFADFNLQVIKNHLQGRDQKGRRFTAGVGRQSNIPLNELTPRKATIAYWRSHGKYSLKSLSWF